MKPLPTVPPPLIGSKLSALVCFSLLAAILIVYGQVGGHAFINFDDPEYITENVHVRSGLTADSIRWALTTGHASNWHPLTWLSHMLDVDLFGMKPGCHHLVNVLFHAANTLLLFVVFRKMTGDLGPSAVVAALFALHPLHVESVAWAAERKDLLSTFFGFVALWRYTIYVAEPVFKNYGPVLIYFILALLAKPMVVTLPFVLLLMDGWPLQRFSPGRSAGRLGLRHLALVVEKIPFFILSAVSAAITYAVQQSGDAVMRLDVLPMGVRITHSLIAYATYIFKLLVPANLAVFYPHPGFPDAWKIGLSALFLGAVSVAALCLRKSQPYVAVGWLWFLGTLVPVIGLVQVGMQAAADRYTYVPLVGLFVILVWGGRDLAGKGGGRRFRPAVAAAPWLIGLAALSWLQVGYWKDSPTLYAHTLQVTEGNYKIHNNMGIALARRNQTAAAERHLREALRIKPDFVRARINLGNVLLARGRPDAAVNAYAAALKVDPTDADIFNNLGIAMAAQGQTQKAETCFLRAIDLRPSYDKAHYNLGKIRVAQGRTASAAAHFRRALAINPLFAQAHNNLGILEAQQGRPLAAIDHYLRALRSAPGFWEAHNNLGIALFRVGKTAAAARHFKAALKFNPDFEPAKKNLEMLRVIDGRPAQEVFGRDP